MRRAGNRFQALASLAALTFLAVAPTTAIALEEGEKPDFRLETLSGKTFTAEALKGRLVVVTFWAVSNPASMDQISLLKEIHEEHAGENFGMIGINRDHDAERARSFAEKVGMNWQHVHERSQPISLSERWNVGERPVAFIFSPEAKLLWRGSPALLDGQVERFLRDQRAAGEIPAATQRKPSRKEVAQRAAELLEKAKAALEREPPDLRAMRRYVHEALKETDAVTGEKEKSQDYRARRARRRLLLADQYRRQGSRRAAIDLYREIVERSPATPAAAMASQRLREMGAESE